MADRGTTRRAFIIGISDYEKLPALPFSKNDGLVMTDILKTLGYKVESLVGKVSYFDFKDSMLNFFTEETSKVNETLLFYYSGHGVVNSGGSYLASSEIDPARPAIKGIKFSDIIDTIQETKSTR